MSFWRAARQAGLAWRKLWPWRWLQRPVPTGQVSPSRQRKPLLPFSVKPMAYRANALVYSLLAARGIFPLTRSRVDPLRWCHSVPPVGPRLFRVDWMYSERAFASAGWRRFPQLLPRQCRSCRPVPACPGFRQLKCTDLAGRVICSSQEQRSPW
jgi:hypothetical protein